jgi:ABC-2 type transport system ATP-binding protein
MSSAVVQTESLTRDFPSVRALDHLSFSVPRGTLFGFLGPNGAGKTTTIRLLLGLLEPTSGQALVLGHNTITEGAAIRSKVGALLEHTGLYEQLTARENLDFFARVWQLSSKERSVRVQELLEEIGLWERRDEPVAKWSRGMRQRLALARTLLHKPSLVLLDEPTAGLDVVAAATVRQALRVMIEEEGVTVLLTTHNMHEAERLCDLIAVIRNGQLVTVDKPDKLMTEHVLPKLKIVATGITQEIGTAIGQIERVRRVSRKNGHLEIEFDGPIDAAPVVTLLVERGVAIQEVRKSRATLEDVFLQLVNGQREESES